MNNDSTAQILAEEAAPLDHFDVGTARSNLDQANAALAAAAGEEDRAAAMIQVEAYDSIVKALEAR